MVSFTLDAVKFLLIYRYLQNTYLFQRGLIDAAAVGIVEKFIGLVFIVPSAMLSTVSAISAQNIGAGNMERAKRTMRTAMMITTGYGVVVSVLLQFFPQIAVGIFTDNTQVLAQGSDYLRGYVWDCIFAGMHFCFSGFSRLAVTPSSPSYTTVFRLSALAFRLRGYHPTYTLTRFILWD